MHNGLVYSESQDNNCKNCVLFAGIKLGALVNRPLIETSS